MRRLIPFEVEVVLTGLRRIEVESLIVIADVLGPNVKLVKAVIRAGGQVAVHKWAGLEVALYS